jgi:PAS domain S-box-containing protein
MDEMKKSLFSRFLETRQANQAKGSLRQEKRRDQFLNVFILAAFSLCAFLALLNLLQWSLNPGREYLFYILGDLAGVATIVVVWILNRSGRQRRAALFFLTFLILSISIAFPISDLDKVFVLYALPTVAASFILAPISSIYFALISIVGYTAAYFISGAQTPYNYISTPTLFLMAFASWMISSRLEKALASAQESEMKLLAMIEQNPAVVYIAEAGAEGKWEYVSPQIEHLLGFSVKEWLENVDLWERQIHPEDLEGVLRMENRCKDTGSALHAEYRIFTRDGRVVWVSDDAVQVQSPGQPEHMLGVMLDISDRKRAEKIQDAIYRISQAVYAAGNPDNLYDSIHEILAELMPVDNFFIALYDPESDLISFAYFVDEYDQKPPARKAGRGLTEYVLRSGEPQFIPPERFLELEKNGEALTVGSPSLDWLGVPLKVKDRTIGVMAVQTYKEGIRFGKQELEILTFVSTQVAMVIDRKRTEDTLWESEERYRRLFEDAVLGIFQATSDGKIIAINPAYARIYGFESIEDLMENVNDIGADLYWDANNRPEIVASVLAGCGPISLEVQYRRKDGTPFTGDLHVWGVWAADGSFQYLEGFVEDITDRKQAETQLVKLNECLLSFGADPLENINRLTALVGELLEADSAFYNRLEDGMLCSWGQWHTPPGYRLRDDPEGHICYDVIKRGSEQPFIVRHLPQTPYAHSDPNVAPYQLQTYVGQAVKVENQSVGSLCMFYKRDFVPSTGQQRLIGISTSAIAVEERRQRAEEDLHKSEERFRIIYESSPVGILSVDKGGKVIRSNAAFENIIGYNEDELSQLTFSDFTYPDDRDIGLMTLREMVEGKRESVHLEKRYIRKNGNIIWVSLTVTTIRDQERNLLYTVSIIEDITERKEADEQIKAALREKEVLLREVHHRVKNNLQVISSLLSLQSDSIHDPQTLQMFNETQSRVRSMSLVHEGLYQSKDLARINFAEYIQKLTASLVHAFGINPYVDLAIEIEDVYLGVDTAIPCGLIINELVSNALKYAFPARRQGKIWVSLVEGSQWHITGRAVLPKTYTLTVRDNGIGFPGELNFGSTETLGLQLVNILTKQLNGSIQMDVEAGTTFTITFVERKIHSSERLSMLDKIDKEQNQSQKHLAVGKDLT